MQNYTRLLISVPALALGIGLALAWAQSESVDPTDLRKWTRPSINSTHGIEVRSHLEVHGQETLFVRFGSLSPIQIHQLSDSAQPSPLACNPLTVSAAEVELDVLNDGLPAKLFQASAIGNSHSVVVPVPRPQSGWLGQPLRIARRAYSNGLLVYHDEATLSFR